MKTYEEYRKDWFEICHDADTVNFNYFSDLAEYYCECDYNRYLGKWKETL